MTGRGRPRERLRQLLCDELGKRAGTAREIAGRTQLAYGTAQWMLRDMVAAGDARKLEPVRVAGVKRPVPVYARMPAPETFDLPRVEQAQLELQRQWSKWWPDAHTLASGQNGESREVQHGED